MRSKQTLTLERALKEESTLHRHVKEGTGALARNDVKLIDKSERSKIGDSLDLDAAVKEEFPEANRWDYVLSLPDSSMLIGVEPHTARDSEIKVVIAKKQHALQCLRAHLRDGYSVAKWFWVSHSVVGFSRMDRARRLLDQHGIAFAGRTLRKLG